MRNESRSCFRIFCIFEEFSVWKSVGDEGVKRKVRVGNIEYSVDTKIFSIIFLSKERKEKIIFLRILACAQDVLYILQVYCKTVT